MVEYANQKPLRSAAEQALRAQGYEIVETTQGGARHVVRKDGRSQPVLVRTSSDRWIGWMRDESEDFRGMDDGELIVVATFKSPNDPSATEVYAFEPADVRKAFEANLAARLKYNSELKASAPIFVCLDPSESKRGSGGGSNLRSKAKWKFDLSQSDHQEDSVERFKEDTRRNFAALIGVPVERVSVEFTVNY